MSDAPDDKPRRPPGDASRNGQGPSARKPTSEGSAQGGKPRSKLGAKVKKGGIWIAQISGNDYTLSHPKCVEEMEPDYVEGIELWREGDHEAARDALRFALQGCGDNLWVHVALGKIALEEDNDPSLARGHFGYAFELAQRAIPPDFKGRLLLDHPANEPLYDAIDGLLKCYEAMQQPKLAQEIRDLAHRWSTGGAGPRHPGPR